MDGFVALATTPEMKKNLSQGVGPIGLITLKTNKQIEKTFIILAIISLIFFILLIKFSHGLGRLTSPGIVLIVTSLPATIILLFLHTALQHPKPASPIPAQELSAMVSQIATNTLPPIVKIMLQNYSFLLLTGVVLILSAVTGKIIRRFQKPVKS